MLQRDYLVRMIAQFVDAIRRSIEKSRGQHDFSAAAEMLEAAIGDATDIDGSILLGLAPESMVSVMQVSGVDPKVTGFIAHGLLLSSRYLEQAGEPVLSRIRAEQARAVADAYGVDLPPEVDEEGMEEYLESATQNLG